MLLKSFKQLFGKPKIKSSAWDAAGSRRRVVYWQPEKSSINSLEHLRSRSRDMVRKNPYAANIIDTIELLYRKVRTYRLVDQHIPRKTLLTALGFGC